MKIEKLASIFLKLSYKVDVGEAVIEPTVDVDIGQAAIQIQPPCPNCAEQMTYDGKGFVCPNCGPMK